MHTDIRIPKERPIDSARLNDTMVFDIETMGIPAKVKEWGKPYPPFVEPKYGNTKDPIKRQALHDLKYEEWCLGEKDWIMKEYDRAALDPIMGRVVAIGYLYPYALSDDGSKLEDHCIIDGLTSSGNHDLEERNILRRFWERFTKLSFTFGHCIGHNIEGFDLPFLLRRSWLLGVKVSPTLKNGRYYHRSVVDTMKVWTDYAYNEMISLDKLARLLEVGHKPDYKGTQFAEDWLSGDKDTAEFYLKNDLLVTHKCYERMYQ